MDALIERHADDIRRIARQHGAGHVRVFGSRAMGIATTSSDVDLLVDFETGRDLLDVVALKQEWKFSWAATWTWSKRAG